MIAPTLIYYLMTTRIWLTSGRLGPVYEMTPRTIVSALYTTPTIIVHSFIIYLSKTVFD